MAFKLNGKPLAVDVAFSHNDIQYPANWLRLSTAEEKTAIGITEVDDPKVYDSRFYWGNGTAKELDDKKETIDGVEVTTLGVKSILKTQVKVTAGTLLAKYDWYVVRKTEKGTAIPSEISTYRDAVRTACDTIEKEIDACSDTAALVTLYDTKEDGTPNMTQYPKDPNS
jgi:hypothetical protein|tara:strand:- start:39 stop:545 length:507 start_codon:yes stop_codon:yes gene_type:complete